MDGAVRVPADPLDARRSGVRTNGRKAREREGK
jgi:hypothetical protein